MSSTQSRYQVGATGRWSGPLEREDGTAVGLGNITAATVTLRDALTGSYIRGSSGTPQDVWNAGSGAAGFQFATVGSDTVIGWDVLLGDVALVNAALPVEEHVAKILVTHAVGSVAKVIRHDHRLRCVDAPGLCTYEDVMSQFPGANETNARETIENMIEGFGRMVERKFRRRFRKSTVAAPTTTVLSAHRGQRLIQLDRYPIDSVVSLKESTDGDFNSATTFAPTDYFVDAEKGQIELRWYDLTQGVGNVQVVHAGGLFRDTGEVDPDIRFLAAARQVGFMWKSRDKLGITSMSSQGQSVTVYSQQPLLPEVEEVLKPLHRPRHW